MGQWKHNGDSSSSEALISKEDTQSLEIYHNLKKDWSIQSHIVLPDINAQQINMNLWST